MSLPHPSPAPLTLCVYCGSSPGRLPEYGAAARALGGLLAQRGIRLVYGGGHVGLMGAVADGALAAGGTVIGVIPRALLERELGHREVTELLVVRDMHERKQRMASLSDGFIALPGGYGTLEEFTEMLTWNQLGFHAKPLGLLNTAGYYDAWLALVAHMLAEGFIKPRHRDLMRVATTPEALLDSLLATLRATPPAAQPRGDQDMASRA